MEYRTLSVVEKDRYWIVQLDRGKVNAINEEMVFEIRDLFHHLILNKSVRGALITGKPHYFSAGLDLIELYSYSQSRLETFWENFIGMMIDLTKFPKPLIAAISGYSPAGGTIIAISCDYRFMAMNEKYHIGLNESSLGIPITKNIFPLYAFWLGNKRAYNYLLEGKLLSSKEALSSGLVDGLAPLDNVMAMAEEKMTKLLQVNDYVLQNAKYQIRKDLIEKVDIDLSKDIQKQSKYWFHPDTRIMLGNMVAKLTKKSK